MKGEGHGGQAPSLERKRETGEANLALANLHNSFWLWAERLSLIVRVIRVGTQWSRVVKESS
jgi:hypothetical protein